jgi:hypothetical protein
LPGLLRPAALFLTLLAALSACAGPGQATGHRVLVGLYDAKTELHLELANASHPDFAGVYSKERQNADLKLAPDELMDQLVVDLDGRLGFAKLAVPGNPPASGPAVRGWVTVSQDGVRRTFVVPAQNATAEQLQAFVNMKLVLNDVFMHVGGLQFVNNPQGGDIFRDSKP